MIDKKGRLFGKVSLVDVFAAVVLIAVFFVVHFTVGARQAPGLGAEQPILITFFHPTLEDFTAETFTLGVPTLDYEARIHMGYVVAIEIGESIRFMPDRQGNEVASPMEGRSSVRLQTRVMGRMSHGAAVLGGEMYVVGDRVFLWAGTTWAIIHISDIQPEGA
ncbi:MAG: DUF4330 domain-containing protein [Defluviitaleaceae bacterium]|nr:DUF4330 domain-containing protein [Defluviitaleaceae bacterium]MCL2239817.1 DUF4330 domain-containing protein [Defluviitaleaceae bacterium]